jgi:SPP1 family predicted phage head-tail adaptor
MNIGNLDRRIVLQAPTATVNDYGERTNTWGTLATVWASIERKASASERNSGEQLVSLQSVTFIIRNSTQVSSLDMSHRVSYNSEYYNILAVQEVGRKEKLRVITELIEN